MPLINENDDGSRKRQIFSIIKLFLKKIPGFGPLLRCIYRFRPTKEGLVFERSDQYWEDRYRLGGNSGAGSYGRLAKFKADFLNDFVTRHQIKTIVEFGCGDGAQLTLAHYPIYTGFDVSKTSIEMCREKFKEKPNWSFFLVGSEQHRTFHTAELALSLDVIYHLVEDEIYESYMSKLFASAEKYVIIYSYNFEKHYPSKHERGRRFTDWVDENATDWQLIDIHKNKYPYDEIIHHSLIFMFMRAGSRYIFLFFPIKSCPLSFRFVHRGNYD